VAKSKKGFDTSYKDKSARFNPTVKSKGTKVPKIKLKGDMTINATTDTRFRPK